MHTFTKEFYWTTYSQSTGHIAHHSFIHSW